MNISPSRTYPETMLKSKVLLQCSVDGAYGHYHEDPGLRTYVYRTRTSRIFIACDINVNYKFSFLSLENSQLHCIMPIGSVGICRALPASPFPDHFGCWRAGSERKCHLLVWKKTHGVKVVFYHFVIAEPAIVLGGGKEPQVTKLKQLGQLNQSNVSISAERRTLCLRITARIGGNSTAQACATGPTGALCRGRWKSQFPLWDWPLDHSAPLVSVHPRGGRTYSRKKGFVQKGELLSRLGMNNQRKTHRTQGMREPEGSFHALSRHTALPQSPLHVYQLGSSQCDFLTHCKLRAAKTCVCLKKGRRLEVSSFICLPGLGVIAARSLSFTEYE